MDRRSFLTTTVGAITGLALAGKAVASVAPQTYVLYGDGSHDDSEALQAWVDGLPVVSGGYVTLSEADGIRILRNGDFRMNKTIFFRGSHQWHIFENCQFHALPALGYQPMFDGEQGQGVVKWNYCDFRGNSSGTTRYFPTQTYNYLNGKGFWNA